MTVVTEIKTLADAFARKSAVEAQIEICEEILGYAYKLENLKEKHGDANVDAVLMSIDNSCLIPLREELERINQMEVQGGETKRTRESKSVEKVKRSKHAKATKGDDKSGRHKDK